MPTKTKASTAQAKRASSSSSLPKTRRPSFSFLGKINITYVLFFLLMIASFLIGVLVTKVQYLEKGVTVNNAVGNAGNVDITGQEALAPQQPTGPVDVAVGNLPPLGDENAPITLIEFSDFECPWCKVYYDDILPEIKKDYIDTGKVKFYFRHFPVESLHPDAQLSHEASECANDQGQFWAYHDLLFENQEEWSSLTGDAINNKLVEYATSLGLDSGSFEDCLSSGKFADNVTKDLEEGAQAGIDGTPGSFINGMIVVGAAPVKIKAQIDAILAE